ncbi:hypothetical protein UCDDS831_g04188 [Diplodia seriata]|uniref:Uncharacterized protein n=1 Tax=Diplodia seriata TaxID=420778 RepID=A0A0G2GDD1_9PEZI|nr:hypothetical protein UCDDS831_g04188 [Diplodia seriata]
MSDFNGFSSGDLPMRPVQVTQGDDEDSIELGSEDSNTDDSVSVNDNSEEETSSLQGGSDGGVPIALDEETTGESQDSDISDNLVDALEDNDPEAPTYGGIILDNDRGFIHPDGREEAWYQQPMSTQTSERGWTTINSSPRRLPASYVYYEKTEDEHDDPVPVRGFEFDIAAETTKEEIEELASVEQTCTCMSSPTSRIASEIPYFNHEKGWWIDLGAKYPQRTTEYFDRHPTRINDDKKRKHNGIEDNSGGSSGLIFVQDASRDAVPALKQSIEATVPRCDQHFPITGVFDEDWKFLCGSRYIKQRVSIVTAPDGSSDDDADTAYDSADKDDEPMSHSPPFHDFDADDPDSWETDDEDPSSYTYTQYVDQAYQLRLIEDDAPAGCRRMNIHSPPADWADRHSIMKLNRWLSSFRCRSEKRQGRVVSASATAIAAAAAAATAAAADTSDTTQANTPEKNKKKKLTKTENKNNTEATTTAPAGSPMNKTQPATVLARAFAATTHEPANTTTTPLGSTVFPPNAILNPSPVSIPRLPWTRPELDMVRDGM